MLVFSARKTCHHKTKYIAIMSVWPIRQWIRKNAMYAHAFQLSHMCEVAKMILYEDPRRKVILPLLLHVVHLLWAWTLHKSAHIKTYIASTVSESLLVCPYPSNPLATQWSHKYVVLGKCIVHKTCLMCKRVAMRQSCLTADLPIVSPSLCLLSCFLANNSNDRLSLDGYFVHQQSLIQHIILYFQTFTKVKKIITLVVSLT